MLKLVVLISGSGSNLQAIIDAIAQNRLHASIHLVISDQVDAYGLKRAAAAHIPTLVIDKNHYAHKDAFFNALQQQIDSITPDLIVLAGFMRILPAAWVAHYYGKLINLHPSLLPAFPGLHTHQRVLATKEQLHGCSVHFVNAGVDTGPIIAQAKLSVQPNESEQSLQQRVHQLEHRLLPWVLEQFAQHHIQLHEQTILYKNQGLTQPLTLDTAVFVEETTHVYRDN